jgi:hypothetical protein
MEFWQVIRERPIEVKRSKTPEMLIRRKLPIDISQVHLIPSSSLSSLSALRSFSITVLALISAPVRSAANVEEISQLRRFSS